MKKAKGMKRGSKEHTSYIAQIEASTEARENTVWWRSRQFVLDGALIALGQLMDEQGNTPDAVASFLKLFNKTYCQVEHDIAYNVWDECAEESMNRDKIGRIWGSKALIDRLLKQYIGTDNFVPFDERYESEQAYTGKDKFIIELQKLVEKKDDEIIKLKSQIKLIKAAKGVKT